jgi:NADPH:quinone reductase
VLKVVDVDDPDPGEGEVRVRVAVSGVNPTDCKSRMGKSSGLSGASDPLPWPQQIPNQDGAGTVDAVGEGVDPARVGQRVWVFHAAHGRPSGTAAQLVCVPDSQAVPLPERVPMSQAAGLGIPYITAHRCLFADGPVDGLTVLVTSRPGTLSLSARRSRNRVFHSSEESSAVRSR